MKKTLLLKTMFLLCAIIFGTSAWADELTGTINFGSADGSTKVNAESVTGDDSQGNTWTITTAGTTSFTQNAGYSQIGKKAEPATSITFTTTLTNDVNITSFSAKFGGFASTAGTVTLKVGDTTVGTGSLNGESDVTISNTSSATGKVLTVTVTDIARGVKAYYISYTYTSGPAKTITGLSYEGTPTKTTYNAGESFDPTGLTVTATFDDSSSDDVTTSVSWTPDPLTEGTTSVTGTYMGQTVNVSGLTVNAAPGSENNPYTVAEAIAYINTLGTSTSPNDVFVSGIISQVDEYNSSYHSITYWISDDGTTTGQMEVYSGKGLNGADFSALKDLEVGDVVTVKGKVKKYNSTPEFDKNNELVSITGRTKVNISTFTATTPTIVVGESTETTVTNDQAGWTPVSYTYESDDEDVATVDANGVVTAVAKGTANITVTANVAPDDANYKAGESKSIEITVTNPFHNVIFSVNGIAGAPTPTEEGAAVTFPANPSDLGGKTFVGWTETAIVGTTDVAPTFVTSATMGTSDLTYYAVFATGSGSGENGWVATDLADLETTDVFVIVGKNASGYFAMSNDNGGSNPPAAVEVTVADGKITTSPVADNIKWNISGDATDGYTFYPNGSTTKFIYCTDTNNGVRVGKPQQTTTEIHAFTVTDGYLTVGYSTPRYIGIYNSQDWRCYTSTTGNSNIKDQTFAFYKYTEGTTYSAYCTSITVPVTIPANKEWITFCSTANLDFSEAIEGLKGAYTITAHESQAITLTATEMTGTVKAGTGLLLRAAEKKDVDQVITIPVAATGEKQTDNMLKGVTEDTDIQPTAGEYTNLGLSNGEFHPYSAAGTLAAGKAYLQIPTAQMPTGGNNARLYIVLDGEATGINAIENSELRIENLDAPMYNLAGQRVTKSYKGVVIVNGKKYINK